MGFSREKWAFLRKVRSEFWETNMAINKIFNNLLKAVVHWRYRCWLGRADEDWFHSLYDMLTAYTSDIFYPDSFKGYWCIPKALVESLQELMWEGNVIRSAFRMISYSCVEGVLEEEKMKVKIKKEWSLMDNDLGTGERQWDWEEVEGEGGTCHSISHLPESFFTFGPTSPFALHLLPFSSFTHSISTFSFL